MSIGYKEYQQLNLPEIAAGILAEWDNNKIFEKSVELREGSTPFVFYEGPPSANGMPGIHHVISRTLKDLVCRYKTMQGFQVKRKGGWDTHGLPVELGVEKLLGITKEDIGKKISVEEYNATCRREVLKFKDQWDDLTRKMGYWVDLEQPYITFENNYIETLWWCLKELYNKNLLYEDVSIQPYSPAAGTGLSSHELNQPGTYKDVKDTSVVAMFKIIPVEPGEVPIHDKNLSPARQLAKYGKNTFNNTLLEIAKEAWKDSQIISPDIYFLAWTTTPWTLPSNLGLTVGKDIEYVLIKTFNPYTHLPINIILAKALVKKYFKEEGENGDFENYSSEVKSLPWKILHSFKGFGLTGSPYEQLLPSEANTIEKIEEITPGAEPFKVVLGDFVTTEDGTGIVHTAPAFGADDFKAGKKNNLGILTLVDKEGKFVEGVGEFSGRFVKDYRNEKNYADVNIDIAVKLKKENRAFKVEKYEHNYPHCWRTDKPIIYYPLDAWFIRTTAVKDRMIELNKTINWKPASTGTGRFGNWLENMVDWNLSRSRYWGTPLPIWRNEEGEEKCIGSIGELNTEIKKANEVLGGDVNKHYLHEGILDLHKPFMDEIILVSESGKPMKRIPDLVDVWFDSGAMPYSQWGLPDTSSNEFGPLSTVNFWKYHKLSKVSPIGGDLEGANFPADFIAEGVDQTRGWFYTLHALGVLLFDSVAYKTVVSNGLVLDKNGNKMSKRLGNTVDPFETISIFGPDATRWYLITNASPWDSLKFDIEGIKEVQRKFFGTLYNTYQFFALYANVDSFTFKEKYIPVEERPEIDRWILSSLNSTIQTVQESLDNYEPTPAGRAIENFVDEHLSNWYVRLCRRRFWKGEYEHDKICAYQTLYECLETISGLIAPLAPFFAEWLFNNLNSITKKNKHSSVHHTDFPKADSLFIDILLERRMELAQNISSLGLSIRKREKIKVRQPLQKIKIPLQSTDYRLIESESVKDIIRLELNVKEIEVIDINEFKFNKKIKPNYKTLGSKFGKAMKNVAKEIESWNNNQDKIQLLEETGGYIFQIDNKNEIVDNSSSNDKNIKDVETYLDDFDITIEDIPGWSVDTKGSLTVALDITITDRLRMEGEAREFVNRIQNIRKDQKLDLTDKILVKVAENEALKRSITQFNAYICAEILADKLEFLSEIKDGITIEVNNYQLKVNITKKGDLYGN